MNLYMLKCTRELLSPGTIRHADMKNVSRKEEVYTHRSLETEGTPHCVSGVQGHTEKHQGNSLSCGLHRKDQARQGWQIED